MFIKNDENAPQKMKIHFINQLQGTYNLYLPQDFCLDPTIIYRHKRRMLLQTLLGVWDPIRNTVQKDRGS